MDSENQGAIQHTFVLGAPTYQAPEIALTQIMTDDPFFY
jgi:hypothetical protein